MKIKKLTSLELYLKSPAQEIIETECLEDIGCGIYPCYYLRYKDKLKISTSVTALIFDSALFELNPSFKPTNYLKQEPLQKRLLKNISRKTPKLLKKTIKTVFLSVSSYSMNEVNPSWYATWETIDKRIKKLRPFEKVTPYDSTITFEPDFIIHDKELIVSETTHYLQQFVKNIEKEFPEHDHIILMGGKDSQLISLITKLNSKKWHVFSAEPNYPLVNRWIEENGVDVTKLFRHDNHNEESLEDINKKIICSDLYSDPRHMRWMPTLKKIAEMFNHKIFFWTGTAADAIYSYHPVFHSKSKQDYFKLHITRVNSWQGNYHQVLKNFVGCPLLSPFHSREIWVELYQHLDPTVITESTDLRKQIGEKLFGKPIKWLDQNPAPGPYHYSFHLDSYKVYLEYINEKLNKS